LFDAYHVPKLLSQQLLPFGRSGDELGELTFGVEQFFASVREARIVREVVADGPREQCSSRVLRVLARLHFRSVLVLSFGWTRFRTVRSRGADSPRVPGERSACSPRTVCFSGFATGGSVGFIGQSAAQAERSTVPVRTVRGTLADSPCGSCRQSAPPGRTVRQSLAALLFGSIPPSFLSLFRVCFKQSFLRLEVDP
jgi:hypothetical protein